MCGKKKSLTLSTFACTIQWYLLQLAVGHTVIIMAYISRVGTYLSTMAHRDFGGTVT